MITIMIMLIIIIIMIIIIMMIIIIAARLQGARLAEKECFFHRILALHAMRFHYKSLQ